MRHNGYDWIHPYVREDLPEECPATINHAIVHLRSAARSKEDPEQVMHDLDIAVNIISRVWEKV